MQNPGQQQGHRVKLFGLIAALTGGAVALLFDQPWILPAAAAPVSWNAIAAFAITAILCDAWFLRISFANIYSSIVFVPLFASVVLLTHPFAILISGGSALIA